MLAEDSPAYKRRRKAAPGDRPLRRRDSWLGQNGADVCYRRLGQFLSVRLLSNCVQAWTQLRMPARVQSE